MNENFRICFQSRYLNCNFHGFPLKRTRNYYKIWYNSQFLLSFQAFYELWAWKLKIWYLKKSNLFSFRLQTEFVSSDCCLSLQIFWLPRVPLFSHHIRKLDSSGVWGWGTRHLAVWPQRLRGASREWMKISWSLTNQ